MAEGDPIKGLLTFKVGEDVYDIEPNDRDEFIRQYPDAQEMLSYKVGKDTFDIDVADKMEFLRQYPSAVPTFGGEPSKKKVSPEPLLGLGGGLQPPSKGVLKSDGALPKAEAFGENIKQIIPSLVDEGKKQVESGMWLIDGKPVTREAYKDKIYDSDFVKGLKEGTRSAEVRSFQDMRDEEMEQLTKRQFESGGKLGDMWEGLVSGSYSTYAALNGIPDYFIRSFQEVTGINLPREEMNNAMKRAAISVPMLRIFTDNREEAEKALKEAEVWSEKQQAYRRGVLSSINSGNYADAASQALNATAESIPYMGAAAATTAVGGPAATVLALGTLGASGALQEMDRTEDPSYQNLTEAEKLTRSGIVGGFEGIADWVAGRSLSRAFELRKHIVRKMVSEVAQEQGEAAAREFAKSSTKEILKDYGKQIGSQSIEEFAAEGGTTVGQMMVDDLMGFKKYDFKDYLYNGFESGLIGSFSGGLTTGVLGAAPVGIGIGVRKYWDGKLATEKGVENAQNMVDMSAQKGTITAEDAEGIKKNIEKRAEAVKAVPKEKIQDTKTIDLVEEKQALNEQLKTLDEAFSQPVKERLEEVNLELKRRQERDFLLEKREAEGIEPDVLGDIPRSVETAVIRAELDKPTDLNQIEEASSWLYAKYKEVSALKGNPDSPISQSRVNSLLTLLGKDIDTLENFKSKSREDSQQQQPKQTTDAVQERSPEEMDVGEQARDGEEMGERNPQKEITQEGEEKIAVEPSAIEKGQVSGEVTTEPDALKDVESLTSKAKGLSLLNEKEQKRILDLAANEATLSKQESQELSILRRKRDKGMQNLEREFRDISERNGGETNPKSFNRQDRQQWRLLQRELQMVNEAGADVQQTKYGKIALQEWDNYISTDAGKNWLKNTDPTSKNLQGRGGRERYENKVGAEKKPMGVGIQRGDTWDKRNSEKGRNDSFNIEEEVDKGDAINTGDYNTIEEQGKIIESTAKALEGVDKPKLKLTDRVISELDGKWNFFPSEYDKSKAKFTSENTDRFNDVADFADVIGVPNEYKFLFDYLRGKGVKIRFWKDKDFGPHPASYVVARNTETGKIVSREIMLNNNPKALTSLIHEAIHAALDVSGSRENKEFQTKLKSLQKDVANFAKNDQLVADSFRDYDTKIAREYLDYITKESPEEVVTFAFTNPDFARFLSYIPSEVGNIKSKSIWGKLKDIILEFIGNELGVGGNKLNELNKILDDYVFINPNEQISEAYHKAKADGSNPQLVEAVEQLLGKPKEATPQATPQAGVVGGENPALKDVESTAKALEGVDVEKIQKIAGIERDEFGFVKYEPNENAEIEQLSKEIPQKTVWLARIKNNGFGIDVSEKLEYKNGKWNVGVNEFETPYDAAWFLRKNQMAIVGESKPTNEQGIKAYDKEYGYGSEKIGDLSKRVEADKISKAYHKAKADGTNPELVEAVEELLGQKPSPTVQTKAEPATQKLTEKEVEGVAKKSSISPKNLRDLYRVNRELFGLDRVKSLASAIAMDRMIGVMAKRANITKSEMYGRLKFEKDTEANVLKADNALFQGMVDGKPVTLRNIDVDVVNGFYSPIEKNVKEYGKDKIKAKDWLNVVGKGDEAVFTGVRAFLEGKDPNAMVSKQEILDYMKDNRISVVEVVKGDIQALNEKIKDAVYSNDWIDLGNGVKAKGDVGGFSVVEINGVKKRIPTIEAENLIHKELNTDTNKTKFSQYQLEGEKENYKEVLVTLPVAKSKQEYIVEQDYRMPNTFYAVNTKTGVKLKFGSYELAKSQAERLSKEAQPDFEKQFKSTHFDEPNILVHLRMNTRTDADGKKVLFLEEIQSDWGQKGKKVGFDDINRSKLVEKQEQLTKDIWERFKFKNPDESTYLTRNEIVSTKKPDGSFMIEDYTKTDSVLSNLWDEFQNNKNQIGNIKRIAPAPFVMDTNSWVKLGLKTALKEAVDQKVDKIAWTTGEQQNERYDLSKTVSKIKWNGDDKSGIVSAYGLDGNLISEEKTTVDKLPDLIGKDASEKLLQQPKVSEDGNAPMRILKGEGLKVGGKGMKGFYGSIEEGTKGIVGGVAEKVFGQKVGSIELQTTKGTTTDNPILRFRDWVWKNKTEDYSYADAKKDIESNSKLYEEYRKNIPSQPSIDITPALRAEVERGLALFQRQQGQQAKGAMVAADGAFVIYALTDPNVSTPLHELAHVFEHYLTDAEKALVQSWAGTKGWTTQTSEKFARGFEKYLAEGKAPTAALQKVFDKFKQWMLDIYNGITGSDIDLELNEDMRDIYAKMMGVDPKSSAPITDQSQAGIIGQSVTFDFAGSKVTGKVTGIKPDGRLEVEEKDAKGKVTRHSIQPEKTDYYRQKAAKVADALRKGKFKGGAMSSIIPPQVWNAAIEAAAKMIEAGGSLLDAIEAARKKLKESSWYKDKNTTNSQKKKARKAVADFFRKDFVSDVRKKQAAAKRIKHVVQTRGASAKASVDPQKVKAFLSVAPMNIPIALREDYLKALDEMTSPTPTYGTMASIYYQIVVAKPTKQYSNLDQVQKAADAFDELLQKINAASKSGEIDVADVRELLKEAYAVRSAIERLSNDEGINGSTEPTISEEQAQDLLSYIGKTEQGMMNLPELKGMIEDLKQSYVEDIMDVRSELDIADFGGDIAVASLLRDLNNLTEEELSTLTPSELHVLHELINNSIGRDINGATYSGEIDIYRMRPLINKAQARVAAPMILKQGEKTDMFIEDELSEASVVDAAFVESALRLERNKNGALYTRLINPLLSFIAQYENVIKNGIDKFDGMMKKYGISNAKDRARIGMVGLMIRDHMAQLDGNAKGKNITNAMADRFGKIVKDEAKLNRYGRDQERGKVTDLISNKSIEKRRNVIAIYNELLAKFDDGSGNIDLAKLWESYKNNDGKALPQRHNEFLQEYMRYSDSLLKPMQMYANEVKGKAFKTLPFHIHRIVFGGKMAAQIKPDVHTSKNNMIKYAGEAGMEASKEYQMDDAVEVDIESIFTKHLESTARDYHMTQAIQLLNATLSAMHETREAAGVDAKKASELSELYSNVLTQLLRHEFSESQLSAAYNAFKKLFFAKALFSFVRTGVEVIAGLPAYFMMHGNPAMSAENFIKSYVKKYKDAHYDVMLYAKSPFAYKDDILNPHVEISSGRIRQAQLHTKALSVFAGLYEGIFRKAIHMNEFQQAFEEETEALLGKRESFDYNKFNNDPSYRAKYKQAILSAVGRADAFTQKFGGPPSKAGQRPYQEVIGVPFVRRADMKVRVQAGGYAADIIGLFSAFPNRQRLMLRDAIYALGKETRHNNGNPLTKSNVRSLSRAAAVISNVTLYSMGATSVYYLTRAIFAKDEEEEEEFAKLAKDVWSSDQAAEHAMRGLTGLTSSQWGLTSKLLQGVVCNTMYNIADTKEEKDKWRQRSRDVLYTAPIDLEKKYGSEAYETRLAMMMINNVAVASAAFNTAVDAMGGINEFNKVLESIEQSDLSAWETLDKDDKAQFRLAIATLDVFNLIAGATAGLIVPDSKKVKNYLEHKVKQPITDAERMEVLMYADKKRTEYMTEYINDQYSRYSKDVNEYGVLDELPSDFYTGLSYNDKNVIDGIDDMAFASAKTDADIAKAKTAKASEMLEKLNAKLLGSVSISSVSKMSYEDISKSGNNTVLAAKLIPNKGSEVYQIISAYRNRDVMSDTQAEKAKEEYRKLKIRMKAVGKNMDIDDKNSLLNHMLRRQKEVAGK